VELIDIAPTLLEAIGAAVPVRMQGRSLFGICTGNEMPNQHRTYVFAECYDTTPSAKPPYCLTMIRNRKHKISVYHGIDVGELYDLEKDPHEFTNLWISPKHRDLKSELIKQCFDAQIACLDPIPQRRTYW
jgi:arylsulfatase A-like enzyme